MSCLRTIIRFFVLEWGNVADRFQTAMVVEPPNLLESGELRTRKTMLDSWVWLGATEGG